ncbi:hypothetical protein H4R34_005839, partial [Dimargaris verticillata]
MDHLDILGYQLTKFMSELSNGNFARFLKISLHKKVSTKGEQLKIYLKAFATHRLGLPDKQFCRKIHTTLGSYIHQSQEQDQHVFKSDSPAARWQSLTRLFIKKPVPKEASNELNA